ncbi:MAG: hypothetical protein JW757_06835 [Anaerolineales bacterium]|nr:hypothetical protein [Anaerolineales bacterium]
MSILSTFQTKIAQRQWLFWAAVAGLLLWAILLAGVFFSTQPTVGLFVDNQVTYFVHGLRLSGQHPYLEADWFAHTRSLHIAFTLLVAGLARIGILHQGMAALDILFRLVFLFSLGWMTNALFRLALRDWEQRSHVFRGSLILSVISIYVLSLWPVFQLSKFFETIGISSLAIAAERFGFYYSFGGFSAFRYYPEPASFSMLIFTALALIPYKRWRWSAALLGIAGLFHASFLIHSGVLAGLIVLYLWLSGERKEAVWTAGIYAVIVLPLAIYILTQMTDPQTAAANLIIATERVPHHTQPARWWDAADGWHLAIILISAPLLLWKDRGLLRWAFLLTTAYVLLGIVLVTWVEAPGLAILIPWRASGYLYNTAQLVFLIAGLTLIHSLLKPWPRAAALIVTAIPLALLLWGAADNRIYTVLAEEYADTTTQPEYPFMQRIAAQTPEEAVLLVPLKGGDYRLGAQRAIYVDWKSHPYLGGEVLEWWERVNFVRQFYALAGPDRQQACQTAGVDYYVLDASAREDSEPVDIAWGDWLLVPCP